MSKVKKLKETYKEFCLAEGNQHIASEFAVLKLQELAETFEVKSILEVGLGIGAIAGSLLAVNKDLAYTGTEDNEFCLKALKVNIQENYKRIQLYSEIVELDSQTKFDLIIIDGKDLGLQQVSRLISAKGIFAIEGDRQEQQKELENLFPNHSYVHCISRLKNKGYSPFTSNHWQGGIKIIFVDPDFKQKLWWGWEKLKTKFKYFYRKFKR